LGFAAAAALRRLLLWLLRLRLLAALG